MASECRNMFYENKKQETTELAIRLAEPLLCPKRHYLMSTSFHKLTMAVGGANTFHKWPTRSRAYFDRYEPRYKLVIINPAPFSWLRNIDVVSRTFAGMDPGTMSCVDLETVRSLIAETENDADIAIITTDEQPACKPGDNFGSDITRLALTYKVDRSTKEISLIVKRPFEDIGRRRVTECDAGFANERLWYLEMVEDLALDVVCRCWPMGDALILEDISTRGYTRGDRIAGLDHRQMTLSLKTLGRIHGAALSLKASNRTVYESYAGRMNETILARSKFGHALDMCIGENADLLEAIGMSSEAERLRLMSANTLYALMDEETSRRTNLNTICHGDYWANNLFFRYGSEGATDCRVLDFQTIREGPAAADIVTLLATNRRIEDEVSLIEKYLGAVRYAAGGSAFDPLDLAEQLNRFRSYGILIGLYYLPAVLMDEEYALAIARMDTRRMENARKALLARKEYKERLVDLVQRYL
ncbi:hypothetical protein AAG570_008284 [Ranatra chinensis]|uniref:CHK kinase-like domain-containing protein n=1 Tax=Ranatra chinensis TaxID=642074 RepID=A0ABD0XSQ2_9HEMI